MKNEGLLLSPYLQSHSPMRYYIFNLFLLSWWLYQNIYWNIQFILLKLCHGAGMQMRQDHPAGLFHTQYIAHSPSKPVDLETAGFPLSFSNPECLENNLSLLNSIFNLSMWCPELGQNHQCANFTPSHFQCCYGFNVNGTPLFLFPWKYFYTGREVNMFLQAFIWKLW